MKVGGCLRLPPRGRPRAVALSPLAGADLGHGSIPRLEQ
jgi:hypothetical protein